MGHYVPFVGDHSIQEAVVSVHFREVSDSEVVRRARDTAQAELSAVLPKAQESHEVAVAAKINLAQPKESTVFQDSGPPRLAGFERSLAKADATPARVLRFFGSAATVSFLEYPGWDTVLHDSLDYLRKVFAPLNLTTNPVVAFGLRYIDRYRFVGAEDTPSAEMLLRRETAYIAPHSFSADRFWHSHSGWFETLEEGVRVLNQVNVGSALVEQAPTVTIDHNAICQLKIPRQSAVTLFEAPDGGPKIEDVMGILHGRNVSLLRDMLQPAMAKKIGLSE